MEKKSATSRLSRIWSNVFVRLAAYYGGAFLFFLCLGILVPAVGEYMDLERQRVVRGIETVAAGGGGSGLPQPAVSGVRYILTPERAIPVLISILGALALALPVAWVRTWTSQSRKTRQSVARALVVMPVAIALVVFLVKGSLALAFSLAGIVAAVRFRNTLSDTTDAVFFLVAMGIGLAAGVQLLSVAFIASALFTTIIVMVWGTRFAADPPRLEGFRLEPPREGPAGGGRRGARAPGSWKEKGDPEGHPREVTFLLYTLEPERVQGLAEPTFREYAKRWTLVSLTGAEGGGSVLRYEARVRKRYQPESVVQALSWACGPSLEKVELAPCISSYQDHPTETPVL